jgi:glycosyltransferase involved in cell wall biosynthesis
MSIGQTLESGAMRAMIRERDDAKRALNDALRSREGTTVCIPCFGQADFLDACLDSVAAQTLPPIEVLVIDDGNPDLSVRDVVNRRTYDFPCSLRCVSITNRGLASARNTGLMLARGKGFLPLDADDTIRPDYLQKTWPLLHSHDVVLTGLQEVGARNGVYNPGFDMEWQDVEEGHLWAMNRFFYCSLFRTASLREVGGYNPQMRWGWEDFDVWVDFMRRGYRFNACLEPLFVYRTTDDGMMARCARDHREELLAEMRRHHPNR